MTDKSQSAGEAVPITLDAVATHLRRRALLAENEALGLAVTVRDLAAENARLQARIAEMEAGAAVIACGDVVGEPDNG